MVELREQPPLVHHRMYRFLIDDFCFEHLLHGIRFSSFFHVNLPNLAEPSLPNDINIVKGGFGDGFGIFRLDVIYLIKLQTRVLPAVRQRIGSRLLADL